MKRKGDWLEAPIWWRRFKPLRWVLAIVILAWIYVTATRMERGPALFPSEPAVSEPMPEMSPPPPAPAAQPPEKAAPKQAVPGSARPAPKKQPPEKEQQQDKKHEIRSLRPV